MFLITSGKVKGFSFKIEDTFSNYISVPTEFPCENVIKNITSGTIDGDRYEIRYTAAASTGTEGETDGFYNYCGWFATTGGSYSGLGTGTLVLEFSTYRGNTVPSTIWKIDRDIFNVDLNTDASKIVSRVLSKTTPQCETSVITVDSVDFTPWVARWGMQDTYTDRFAASGTNYIFYYDTGGYNSPGYPGYGDYYMRVGSENINIVYGGETYIGATVFTVAGAPGEGTDMDHATMEPVINITRAKIVGDPEVLSHFPNSGPATFLVGSEIIVIGSCYDYSPNNGYIIYNFGGDLGWRRPNGVPHPYGTPVYDLNQYTKSSPASESILAKYGYRDTVVSPLGCVDRGALDCYTYGVLSHATSGENWGRCTIPAHSFPSTVEIGDWICIENKTSTATNVYRLVGYTFDQNGYKYTLEFGVSEDFYIESTSDNRTTFDLALQQV